ncbi:hypothetical protein H8I69_07600 [Serratia fonticola]|uniref:hypothetical protein n=1 Tax=Serratia fonticola TaxID=47917 RepID=UPI0015C66174|nr:hypothetical protein [Serratia fonticola]MBC3378981.1 hypothetical protein [Serratia fonticola]NYA38181.1 hypothetical protein [Serratia fonticola]
MVKSLRNLLIGLLCLSTVGCANMTNDDVAITGVVIGLGALVALALLSDGDNKDHKEPHRKEHGDKGGHKGGNKHGYGKDHGKGHPGRR